MKIYTKTGDLGETGLVSGSRVSKSNLRIDLYGEVDELNTFVGSLLVVEVDEVLFKIQHQLFNLGSLLACESDKREKYKLSPIDPSIIGIMENKIDELNTKLPNLKNFILPGGSEAGARAHLCRVVSRRVERKLVAFGLESKMEIPEHSLVFLNRLSDYFFVFSRYCNQKDKINEIIWSS